MTNPLNPSIAQSFKTGEKVAGCYTLKEALGEQGFCFVWLAHDEELNRDIALHFVPDSVAADARAMAELKQEAKRNRQLIHPRIVRVHDLVEDEKWAAVSMDYVPGETFAELQGKRPKNAFNPSEIAPGITELCQTIEDAHRIDLLHRDLTPDSILATGNGVMVQKFGISRVILDSLARSGRQIEASRDMGYISPQHLDGDRVNRADDIYSLGACLFSLLTGAAPFADGDIISQIRKTVPPRVSERRAALGIGGEPIPKAWDEMIAACLAKTPEERPKSAAEVGARFSSASIKAGAAATVATGAAEVSAAAPAAPAVAKETAKESPKDEVKEAPKESEKEAPKTPASEREGSARQQKRPWTPGPGKTPIITEATIVSKTDVPKPEGKSEGPKEQQPGSSVRAPEPPAAASGGGAGGGIKKGGPGGPVTPSGFPLRAFVAVEGDSKPEKQKSSAGLMAGGVVLVLILVVGYLVARNNGGSGEQAETAASTSGSNAENSGATSESTSPPTAVEASPAASPGASPGASPAEAPVNLAAVPPSPSAMPSPAPTAIAAASPSANPESSQNPSPAAAPAEAVASMTNVTDAQAQQLIADKTKAIDQAKAALADAEKAARDQTAAQTEAAAAVQQMQAATKQKADAAASAKKAADAAATALKEQQDSFQKAQADADAAQKEAAAKAQAVEQMRKAVQDTLTSAQQQQTAAQQAQAESDQLAKTVADRQRAAEAAGKAAADAEKARQAQVQALSQAQASLAQLQAGLAQAHSAENARRAAEEAARIQKAREAAAAQANAQVAAAAKAAADAQKALDAARKAVADAEKAQAEAQRQAEAARNGTLPVSGAPSVPATTPTGSPAPAYPAASPAAARAMQSPAAPTLSIRAPNPHLKVDQALSNSLGMRFAPVGKVLFSVWLTRVQDFEAFAKATAYKPTGWQDPGFKQAPDHPVVNVSWNDANQFCLWLTEQEHHQGILSPNETYRLPTDMEWSYAAGLPPETGHTPESRDMDVPDVYPWGTDWPPPAGSGNYTGEETDSDVAIKGYNDGFAWTSPVGSFKANQFGLYDMGGNVWEWCSDWWNSEQKQKVVRGGSWDNGALKLSLLSSCRERASADLRADNYGFRVVIAEEASKPKPKRR